MENVLIDDETVMEVLTATCNRCKNETEYTHNDIWTTAPQMITSNGINTAYVDEHCYIHCATCDASVLVSF